MITRLIRTTTATALTGTARVLRLASAVSETVAERLRNDRQGTQQRDGQRGRQTGRETGRQTGRQTGRRQTAPEGPGPVPAGETGQLERIDQRAREAAGRRRGEGQPAAPPEEPATQVTPTNTSPSEIVLDEDGFVSRPETHIAELADKTADEVVREVQNLSTDELRRLFEYETAHKNRKSVLQAIERASSPPREETVHSTRTRT